MWFLLWFQFVNSQLSYFEIGQYETELSCMSAKDKASVIVTNNNQSLVCFLVTANER